MRDLRRHPGRTWDLLGAAIVESRRAFVVATTLAVAASIGAGGVPGEVATTLAATGVGSSAPLRSPQASGEFAYVSVIDGNFEVFGAAVDDVPGSNLSDDPALDYQPGWSGDGSRVLFYSNRSGNNEIYSVHPDGTDVRNLTNHPAADNGPAGAADGRVAFVSDRDGDREIFVMNADGSEPRQLTDNSHYDDSVAWSPDGTEIVYTAIPHQEGDIFVVDVASGAVRPLAALPGHEGSPDWSPNGEQIAFNGAHEGEVSIYMVDAGGANLRKLANVFPDERHPRWSPDGEWLLYTATRGSGNDADTDIWMMRPDGSDRRAVVVAPGRQETAAWRPAANPAYPFARAANHTPKLRHQGIR